MLANAASLIICGLLAGLVVAAAAFPAVALTGLAAKAGADDFDSLPIDLEVPHAPQVTNVYASDGKTLITSLYRREPPRRADRPDLPAHARRRRRLRGQAVLHAQRRRRPRASLRAFVADQQRRGPAGRVDADDAVRPPRDVLFGGHPAAGRGRHREDQRPARSARCTWRSRWRSSSPSSCGDKQAAKHEILDRYLNIAPFGHRRTASTRPAEVYFNEPAEPADASTQAALLAGLLQAHHRIRPDDGNRQGRTRCNRRNNHVLPNMLSSSATSPRREYDAQSRRRPVVTKHRDAAQRLHHHHARQLGFFCDYLYRWWFDQPAFGADTYARENQLETGGYKIVTTLNVKAQDAADKSALKQVKQDRQPTAMMLTRRSSPAPATSTSSRSTATTPTTSRNNGRSTRIRRRPRRGDRQLSEHHDPARHRQLGDPRLPVRLDVQDVHDARRRSTTGLPLSYKINTPAKYKSNFPDTGERANAAAAATTARPTPATNEKGPYNMWTGFGHSVNTYFVPLEDRIGTAGPIEEARPTRSRITNRSASTARQIRPPSARSRSASPR